MTRSVTSTISVHPLTGVQNPPGVKPAGMEPRGRRSEEDPVAPPPAAHDREGKRVATTQSGEERSSLGEEAEQGPLTRPGS